MKYKERYHQTSSKTCEVANFRVVQKIDLLTIHFHAPTIPFSDVALANDRMKMQNMSFHINSPAYENAKYHVMPSAPQ